jgi:ABC-type dipeptide/oligopeptide/nickel transport system ATPase component
MEKIGLNEELLGMRADVLSASESQRVDLARSLIVSPQLILLDNPEVGAVNADGGVMTALVKAEKGLGRAFLIATNEPETAIALADRVAVLHAGRVIELGRQSDVFRKPAHPVTLAMLEGTSLPATDPTRPPVGCAFAEACAFRQPICQEKEPMLAPLPGRLHLQVAGTHRVACFHPVLD